MFPIVKSTIYDLVIDDLVDLNLRPTILVIDDLAIDNRGSSIAKS
jgi:hypothetical protein